MSIEIPKNIGEQLDLMSPYNQNMHLTHQELHIPLIELMKKFQVRLLSSDCRTKSLRRLREKIHRQGWDRPVPDIHAARLILGKADFVSAREAIISTWPTPEFVYLNIQSFRDYDDPETRAKYNPFRDQGYRATHLNIHVPFGARIAEVQLFTVADYAFYIRTQNEYLQRERSH
jgi:ppGpp synthetase/RelA/SpoT-type nucleotidyltranferase